MPVTSTSGKQERRESVPQELEDPVCHGRGGIADVREWYDDTARCFRITVNVHNRVWGKLFGYRGSFRATVRKVRVGEIPVHILPVRQEVRE